MAKIIDIEGIGPARAEQLGRHVPSPDQVKSRIARAGDLPRVVQY